MAYSAVPTRSTTDANSFADINQLQENAITGLPVGAIIQMAIVGSPAKPWLKCDGSAVSRVTYATLYAAITVSLGAVTISNGTPGVITLASGDWTEGQCIELTTTGGLPTGLSVNTNYYIHRTGAGTANVSTTRANLDAGTYVATSSAGSGVHTARYCPYGISTVDNFLLPDYQARVPKGVGTATIRGNAKTAPAFGGDEEDRFQGHYTRLDVRDDAAGNTSMATAVAFAANAGGVNYGYNSTNANNDTGIGNIPITDGTNGTPRTGLTTRENTIGTNYYIKYE